MNPVVIILTVVGVFCIRQALHGFKQLSALCKTSPAARADRIQVVVLAVVIVGVLGLIFR